MITCHNSWPHLARRFHLNSVGTIEPRPAGVAPPSVHLSRRLRTICKQKVAGIVVGTREPRKDAKFLSDKTGIPIVMLAESVGTTSAITSYEELIEFNVKQLENILIQGKNQ